MVRVTSRATSSHSSSEYGIRRRPRRRSGSAGEATSVIGSALRPAASQCAIGNGCRAPTIELPWWRGNCRPSNGPAASLNQSTRWLLRSTTTTASGNAAAAAR